MTRTTDIHAARTYLAEARKRRERHRGFAFTLLAWAGNARRRAAAQIVQRELFA